MDYKKVLKEARERSNLTQKQAASWAGVSVVYLSHIETGYLTTPGADKWAAICAALRIDPRTGKELPSPSLVEQLVEPGRCHMIQDEKGVWRPFNFHSDPNRFEVGTVLNFRDVDGSEYQVQIICGPRGKKIIEPV